MEWAYFLLAAIVISVLATVAAQFLERKGRRERFCQREVLPLNELYSRHYGDFRECGIPQSAFERIWIRIGHILHVEPEKLRPSDTLLELAVLPRWAVSKLLFETDVDELIADVEAAYARTEVPPPHCLDTIDDVLRYLVSRE